METKIVKVTNPIYIGKLAPQIKDYTQKLPFCDQGITYESFYSAITQTVQYGGNLSEFWVALDEQSNPVAFGQWHVLPLPYVGAAMLDHIYKWDGNSNATEDLIRQFINFAKFHRCVYMIGLTLSDSIFRLWKKMFGEELNIQHINQVSYLLANF